MKKITVTENGPYAVSGKVPLKAEQIVCDKDGFPLKWKFKKKYPDKESYLLCRCGESKNKPFCDKSHKNNGFNGKETANNDSFDKQAEIISGPNLILKDSRPLCVHAGFCDRAGGIWELTKRSDETSKELVIEEAGNCPSGRLVVQDKQDENAIEPAFDQSISVTYDEEGIEGPLWVKGGIPVKSAAGRAYEKRNRVTLCQCGRSNNKPFCDGTHNPTR